jgi:hypothetical protein
VKGAVTMSWVYHMVQIPEAIEIKQKEHVGNEAAAYLESLCNQQAAEGWEFYRIDEVRSCPRDFSIGIRPLLTTT